MTACRSCAAPTPLTLQQAGVPRAYWREKSFSDFDQMNDSVVRARDVLRKWADDYPDVRRGLLLHGPSGVGKTHLLVSVLHRILQERRVAVPALFVHVSQLLYRLRSAWKDDVTDDEVLAGVRRAELLVLDDIGAVSPPWAQERFHEILTGAFHTGARIVCSTSWSPTPGVDHESLADRITPASVSLLQEACRGIRMRGDDYRVTVLQPGASV